MNPVDILAVLGGFNEASGDASEHGSIKVGICGEGGGEGVGGERYNWGQRGATWGRWGTVCWRFIGDIDGYVRHRALVVEGAVREAAEAEVLVAVVVGDVVLKAKEEMPEGFSRLEVELANAKWGTGHAFLICTHPSFMLFRGFCRW